MHESDDKRLQAPAVRRTFRRVVRYGPGTPSSVLGHLENGSDRLFDGAALIKNGDRCTVARIEADGRPLVIKRYNLKSAVHTTVHFVLRSRAAWCWRNGHRLLEAGLATPEPLAYCECRVGLLRLQSYLLTTFVEGPTLRKYVLEDDPPLSEIERLADEFAGIWRGLGALCAAHDDMKATNFIVGDDGRLWMVDLDGMRTGLSGPLYRRARRIDLERFLRNWRDRPEVAAIFRARIDRDGTPDA